MDGVDGGGVEGFAVATRAAARSPGFAIPPSGLLDKRSQHSQPMGMKRHPFPHRAEQIHDQSVTLLVPECFHCGVSRRCSILVCLPRSKEGATATGRFLA
ncbi:hypothetical protein AAFF_G00097730 [Aldrovandia affinis]|uniref:Uncharacterized protein n=1 Tax=Aldrovandia affinis TaxID=143900 RepID=A0AAD7RVI2_9TELE|nr:hypothetical protein AAFF_G00097730 [Aldrovandia affinis]